MNAKKWSQNQINLTHFVSYWLLTFSAFLWTASGLTNRQSMTAQRTPEPCTPATVPWAATKVSTSSVPTPTSRLWLWALVRWRPEFTPWWSATATWRSCSGTSSRSRSPSRFWKLKILLSRYCYLTFLGGVWPTKRRKLIILPILRSNLGFRVYFWHKISNIQYEI